MEGQAPFLTGAAGQGASDAAHADRYRHVCASLARMAEAFGDGHGRSYDRLWQMQRKLDGIKEAYFAELDRCREPVGMGGDKWA